MKALFQENKWTIVVLLAAVIIFIGARIWAAPPYDESGGNEAGEYAEYDTGTVLDILSDSTVADEVSDGA